MHAKNPIIQISNPARMPVNFLTQLKLKKNRTPSVLVSAPQNLVQTFEFAKLKAERKKGLMLLFVKLADTEAGGVCSSFLGDVPNDHP